MATENGRHTRGRSALWLIALILLVAAALRVGYANQKSLVLDEFHSYFHASRPSIEASSRRCGSTITPRSPSR